MFQTINLKALKYYNKKEKTQTLQQLEIAQIL
jgi:hypothetical protein